MLKKEYQKLAFKRKHEIERLTENLASLGVSYSRRGKELSQAKYESLVAHIISCVLVLIIVAIVLI